jgi:hypothetical protein
MITFFLDIEKKHFLILDPRKSLLMRVVKMRVMRSIIPLSFVAMIASICHVTSVYVSVKMRHDPALFALIRGHDCPRHLTRTHA